VLGTEWYVLEGSRGDAVSGAYWNGGKPATRTDSLFSERVTGRAACSSGLRVRECAKRERECSHACGCVCGDRGININPK